MSAEPPRNLSLSERLLRGARWRAKNLSNSLRDRVPPVIGILAELGTATGLGRAKLASEMYEASKLHGIRPEEFVALLLWEVPRETRREFLVSRTVDPFVISLLDPSDRLLGQDKPGFAAHDSSHGVPWLPTLAVMHRLAGPRIEGAEVVERVDDLWPAIDRLAREREVVLKPAFGLQGRGFYLVGSDGRCVDASGRTADRNEIAEHVFRYSRHGTGFGYLAQPLLRSHPKMVELTGVTGLATMRIVTARHAGGTDVIQSFLKVPAPGCLTDNFRRGVSGTMIAGMDTADGRLGELVGRVRPEARHVLGRTARHPVTGKEVTGSELPFWRDALRVARQAAAAHSGSAMFAWDVALGPQGWLILDGNPVWGPVGGQACAREGLRPTLTRLYPENARRYLP